VTRLLLTLTTLAACTGTPDSSLLSDGGLSNGGLFDGAEPDSGSLVTVVVDRPFGLDGELPTHLLATGTDAVLLLTSKASYRLDRDGRMLRRTPLPSASSGSIAVPTSAAWDGVGLGATVRWGNDAKTSAGTYLALTDGNGVFSPPSMIPLGSTATAARTTWDSETQRHLVLTGETQGSLLELALTRVARSKNEAPSTLKLQAGLSASVTIGDWVGPASRLALCTVEPGGHVRLRTFQKAGASTVELTDPDRDALGSCRLATSGRSFLVTWVQRALPPTGLDAGPAGHPSDLGPGSLSFNVPVVQVVDPDGKLVRPRSLRLSSYPGTVQPESVLWDGRRYLVLTRTAFRGGRLELTVLDETGMPQYRELELPLAYEPGRLLGAKMALGAAGEYWLVYTIRRPHDGGVLHLVRFSLP